MKNSNNNTTTNHAKAIAENKKDYSLKFYIPSDRLHFEFPPSFYQKARERDALRQEQRVTEEK